MTELKIFEKPRERVQKEFRGESRTQQHLSDGTDVNVIMRRYEQTGFIESLKQRAPMYGHFDGSADYRAHLDRVQDLDDLFQSLPSRIRAAVENDPAQLLDLVNNPERREELVELGLLPQPEAEEKPEKAAEVLVADPAGQEAKLPLKGGE